MLKVMISFLFAVWLVFVVGGCSHALVANDYNKSGPQQYSRSVSKYDRTVIIIKKPKKILPPRAQRTQR